MTLPFNINKSDYHIQVKRGGKSTFLSGEKSNEQFIAEEPTRSAVKRMFNALRAFF